MKEGPVLLRYLYRYYVQGTEETDIGYALVYGRNPVATLLRNRNKFGVYEIDTNTIEDMTLGDKK